MLQLIILLNIRSRIEYLKFRWLNIHLNKGYESYKIEDHITLSETEGNPSVFSNLLILSLR
jgi:hypothetical protein